MASASIDLRGGQGQGQDDGVRGHAGDHLPGDQAAGREADEDVGAFEGVGQAALEILGAHQAGDLRFGPIHPHQPVHMQRPVAVAEDDVVIAGDDQALGHPDAGRAGAADDDAGLREVFPHHLQGVDHGRQHDDAGGVVFMVQDRGADGLADAGLDGEAFGRGDALQAEAPEGRRQGPDDFHDFIGVLGREGDGYGVHVGKGLVEHRLGLEFGERGQGPDIAVFINLAAIGDQGDGIAPAGVLEGGQGILVDFPADGPHPGGIDAAQHVGIPDGHLAFDADQAAVAAAIRQGIRFGGHAATSKAVSLINFRAWPALPRGSRVHEGNR